MKTWIYAVLLLALVLPAARADYDSATAAYNNRDYNASFMEFRRLAVRGHAKAQFMLGNQYLNGEGVFQDFVQAHKWFNLAAAAGHPLAAEYRDRVATRMTRAQVAEAQQLARQWRPDKGRSSGATDSATGVAVAPAPGAGSAPVVTDQRTTVMRIQRLLNANGYDAGPADGQSGRRTREAIRRFQADNGLFQDGEASPSLLTFMEAQFPPEPTTSVSTSAPAASAATVNTPIAAPAAQTDPRLQQLLGELQQLARDGERSRAADSRFLGRLRELTQRYSRDWLWQRLLLDEAFNDAAYVRNPAWQISSGDFYLVRGEGLQSRVTTAPARQKTGKQKGRDLAINILGSILNSQGGGSAGFGAPAPQPATIQNPQQISNGFALRLVLQAGSATGGVFFDLYQGRPGENGYRLGYTPGRPGQLQLQRLSNSSGTLIATDNRSVDLGDGADHEILWTRDPRGRMRVSVDGMERLRGTSTGNMRDFDGLAFSNSGGEYTLRNLRLYVAR